MLNKAKEWGILHKENPCLSVKWFRKTPGKLRFLSKEKIIRLLDSCTDYLSDIVMVALNTGMRKGEVLILRQEDVDLDLCLIHVRDSKSGESRDIPINSTLIDVLARLKKNAKGQQYLFENPGTCMAFGDVKRSFKSALKEAKIEGATFHTLRHTFASHLVMEGIDLPTVASLLGHKDISMTMRYSHLSLDHRTLAVEKLSSLTGTLRRLFL
jgi:integrase